MLDADAVEGVETALPQSQWLPRDEVDPSSMDEESLNVLCDSLVLELSVAPTAPQQREKAQQLTPALREYQQTLLMDSANDEDRGAILKFMRGDAYWRSVTTAPIGGIALGETPVVSQSL